MFGEEYFIYMDVSVGATTRRRAKQWGSEQSEAQAPTPSKENLPLNLYIKPNTTMNLFLSRFISSAIFMTHIIC